MMMGSPVFGRAQDGRGAPPPSAAAFLTPVAHRSGLLPSGRRGAPTGLGRDSSCRRCRRAGVVGRPIGRVPGLVAGQHGIEDEDYFAHASDQGELCLFAPGPQFLVIGAQDWIVLGRRPEGGHEQQVAQLLPAALDVAFAGMLAAVVIVGRKRRPERPAAGCRSGPIQAARPRRRRQSGGRARARWR